MGSFLIARRRRLREQLESALMSMAWLSADAIISMGFCFSGLSICMKLRRYLSSISTAFDDTFNRHAPLSYNMLHVGPQAIARPRP